MSVEDPKTFGRARLSFADQKEIDDFIAALEKFERGEISPADWRAYRLVRGTYGQRQEGDLHMLRVKVPQGVLSAAQLRALAQVAEEFSRGFGHITTRQNLQLHFVKLRDAGQAMQLLGASGLTTREACGNSVRNITCCPHAGVSEEELFDVTPYAEALTRYLLRHKLTSSLPRKFKIAFEGCPEDHAYASVNDLGFRARQRGSERGFRVTVGGGTAIKVTSGHLLHEHAPAGELFEVAEAVVRIFHRLGDRQHRQRNRLKFLIAQLGWEGFLAEYERERERIRAEALPRLPFDPNAAPVEEAPDFPRARAPEPSEVAARVTSSQLRGPGLAPEVKPVLGPSADAFARWRRTNVRPQKQRGFATAFATVPLGDLTGGQMRVLGELALAYGDGLARTTQEQDVAIRWVREEDIHALYLRLSAAGLGLPDAGTAADVTACPGAESCRLAVTHSRGLGKALGDFLRGRPDLVAAVPGLKVKISGCPNGCGLHHVAGIGFQGSLRKVSGKAVPQYFVMIGGSVGEQASFGRIAAKVPARRLLAAAERLLGLYLKEKREGEPPTDFFRRLETRRARALLSDLEEISAKTATPQDFVDLGQSEEFTHVTMDGECAA
ncbi:MAG: nitrite/sulfite reductase [Myxococcales bacterium]|nr:nitrite/sulfite reductase [Myxococcales bacterium]